MVRISARGREDLCLNEGVPRLTRNSAEGVLTSQRIVQNLGKKVGLGTTARGRETLASNYRNSAEGVPTSQRLVQNLGKPLPE